MIVKGNDKLYKCRNLSKRIREIRRGWGGADQRKGSVESDTTLLNLYCEVLEMYLPYI